MSHGMKRTTLDNKWHRLDGQCRALKDACPKKADDHIGKASTALFHVDEFPASQTAYFLGLARQHLYAAERLLRAAMTDQY